MQDDIEIYKEDGRQETEDGSQRKRRWKTKGSPEGAQANSIGQSPM